MGGAYMAVGQTQSVLRAGDWYKIAIMQDGAYRIDANVLKKLGIDRSSINPANLTVYGNAVNGILPQANSADRPVDLIENATMAVGLEDGSFDKDDYLLFYGKSPHRVDFDPVTRDFLFEKNIYSDSSFYFVTEKKQAAKRMATRPVGTTTGTVTTDYWRTSIFEEDLVNILSSGREWFGERLSNGVPQTTIKHDPTGYVTGSPLTVYVGVVSEAVVPSAFHCALGGETLGTINMTPMSGDQYETQADIRYERYEIASHVEDKLDLTIGFEISSGNAKGYIDYGHLVSRHVLNLDHGVMSIYPENEVLAISGGETNRYVWDITDPTAVQVQQALIENESLRFEAVAGVQYWAFDESHIEKPIVVGEVANQNLHGLASAEVLYITNSSFEKQAQRLADFRATHDGLATQVVTVGDIYNEFSSGRQDLTALRDFIKHQYDSYGTLKYVTLLGDCSYDYKDRISDKTNWVPVYEARNSVHPLYSYSSDDFLGFMEDDEGEWIETSAGDHTLELGIGRVPVRTPTELAQYVDKVIRYETSRFMYGNWKNKVVFFADDEDGKRHQRDADRLATLVDTSRREFNIRRIFLDSYEQVGAMGELDQRSPRASDAFLEALTKGSLILNYVGHGNERVLATEQVFTVDMVEKLNNRHLLPFVVTATCAFGNYDNPEVVSGGEQILLAPEGGAIAMLTSTRDVYADTNYEINKAFYEALSQKDGQYFKRLGDLMKETKNNSLVGFGNRNYGLLGDASMRLAFPESAVELTHINGQALDDLDSLKALGNYTLSGQIMTATGDRDEFFEGKVTVTLFDKPAPFTTLGDEGDPATYQDRDVILFQGDATVTNGTFTIETIVSKNIDYDFGEGKVSFYAQDSLRATDAHGYYSEVIVGGIATDPIVDQGAPVMHLYMGDTGFKTGDQVGENTILLARLQDISGINTSRLGADANIMMYLDDEEGVNLNAYYTSSLDTYQEGWVLYPMNNLSDGKHSLRLVAYDNQNNKSESTVTFQVSDELKILLSEVKNFPNPMQDQTTFSFLHDRLGEDLDISLSITNLQGQQVLRIDYEVREAPTLVEDIEWDGSDANGNKVKKGIYIYKLVVQSNVDGAKSQVYNKIIVL
ncbi:Peptidase family C25 [Reichenbachiella agariperforans]|uniref:Peptidase family C25 n=1 Tax=Reichenbachiella agariperforans TaxID=156994 RepID=A0A1M6TRA2_REIAG|nr:type IX secretion system sortase PorU [Reichenbachiella agariperforans]SHK59467.1 Peptidase family C25 [Reichenbachiella agariperforans]